MDDVFGNSSTETVISVHDETDLPTAPDSEGKSSTDAGMETNIFEHENKENLNCASSIHSTHDGAWNCEVPHSSILRHSHSTFIRNFSVVCHRPRSNSEPKSSENYPYQNVRACFSSLPFLNTPSYVNLSDWKPSLSDRNKLSSSLSLNSSSNSSASSICDFRHPADNVKHSYIKLWTGDSEVPVGVFGDSRNPSTSGYVSMASPYVNSPNSSLISNIASRLSSLGSSNTPTDVFCPFCPRPFTKEILLKSHMETIHSHDLQTILSKESIYFYFCPLCSGRFLIPNLLPSHILEFHREYVLDILDSQKKYITEEIYCPFCPKKLPSSKYGEEMLCHVIKRHNTEYERTIHTLFQPVECLRKEVTNAHPIRNFISFSSQLQKTSTPGLSVKFRELACGEFMDFENSNLEETWNSHCGVQSDTRNDDEPIEHTYIGKGILRSRTDLARKPSVKRELRFSVPPVTNEEFYIPESPESDQTEMVNGLGNFTDKHQSHDRTGSPPVRVDSLSSADFIELSQLPRRKRRRLGVGLSSKKSFKKSKGESLQLVENVFEGLKNIGCGKHKCKGVVATSNTRTFRRPKPIPSPRSSDYSRVNALSAKTINVPPPPSELQMTATRASEPVTNSESHREPSPFGNVKLYSPLTMFRCNGCRIRFSDNESLAEHVRAKHRNLLGYLKPQFGCGICSAKFYENKYLVKHCLQHHTSLLEIRSPKPNKITIYRFTND